MPMETIAAHSVPPCRRLFLVLCRSSTALPSRRNLCRGLHRHSNISLLSTDVTLYPRLCARHEGAIPHHRRCTCTLRIGDSYVAKPPTTYDEDKASFEGEAFKIKSWRVCKFIGTCSNASMSYYKIFEARLPRAMPHVNNAACNMSTVFENLMLCRRFEVRSHDPANSKPDNNIILM